MPSYGPGITRCSSPATMKIAAMASCEAPGRAWLGRVRLQCGGWVPEGSGTAAGAHGCGAAHTYLRAEGERGSPRSPRSRIRVRLHGFGSTPRSATSVKNHDAGFQTGVSPGASNALLHMTCALPDFAPRLFVPLAPSPRSSPRHVLPEVPCVLQALLCSAPAPRFWRPSPCCPPATTKAGPSRRPPPPPSSVTDRTSERRWPMP